MFGAPSKSKVSNLNKIDTLVNSNVTFEGKVSSSGTVRFDCEIVGDVSGEGVVIGETGKVIGNINCDDIVILGKVEGNIICKNKIHIKSTGSQIGDISFSYVIIDEGAKFEGSCRMNNSNNTSVKSIPSNKVETKNISKDPTKSEAAITKEEKPKMVIRQL